MARVPSNTPSGCGDLPMPSSRVLFLLAATAAFAAPAVARAQEKELTLYSARHYQTDERLYAHFTEKTGIKVKRVEGSEDELLERIKKEGANGPADVFIPVDLRTGTWFAYSTRARVIVYDRTRVKAADVRTYLDLADPKLKGKVCVRSGRSEERRV